MQKNFIRFILVAFIISLLFKLNTQTVIAAKSRIKSSGTGTKAVSGTSYSSAKLSRGTNSVVLTFLNLSKINRVGYTLSYETNGISQGVVGSISPAGQTTDSRDLYFGTCSHGVCTPHYNLTNASLVVTATLKSGATNTKRYRIKI